MIASGTDPVITPGFRFYPTEEELLGFYLRHRLANTRPDVERVIPVVDVYSYHPSDLLSMAGEASVGDTEQWFFFCPRGDREVHGGRPARTTPSGYWKATGSPSHVFSSANQMIGVRRTMVFYQGRAPAGTKTKWKMNEYKATVDEASGVPATPLRLRNEFSICRVYISNGTLRSFDRRPPNASCNDHQPAQQEEASSRNPAIAGKGSAAEMDVGVPAGEEGAVDWNSLTDYFSLDFDCNWGGAWPI